LWCLVGAIISIVGGWHSRPNLDGTGVTFNGAENADRPNAVADELQQQTDD
jgi:hypothetical protein